MAYLGRGIENLSDRVVLDSLTASATASYTLQLNSVNFVPSSASSLTVSLNGVIQKPDSSYTVSGSTLTFASALTSSDSIDFIIAERGITLQTPSAGSVGTSQLASTAVTTAKIADDAVTFDKMTGQNYPAFLIRPTSAQSFSNNTYTKVAFDTAVIDTDSGFDNSNDRWTVPTGKGGKYLIAYQMMYSSASSFNINVHTRVNGATNSGFSYWGKNVYYDGLNNTSVMTLSAGDYIELWSKQASGSSVDSYYFDQGITLFLSGYRIGD